MAVPRLSYLSAFRNYRTKVKAVQPPSVSSPVGAADSTTVQAKAQEQAAALRKRKKKKR